MSDEVILSVAGLLLGAGFARVFWRMTQEWLAEGPVLLRTNYAGRQVPLGGGIPLIAAVMMAAAVWSLCQAVASGSSFVVLSAETAPHLALVAGFGLLGLVDDLLGGGSEKGFSGHLRAFSAGRMTTGLWKLLGGAALALAVVGAQRGGGWLLVDAAVVALGANAANLFDLAPGRLLKVALFSGGCLLFGGWGSMGAAAVSPLVGAGAAMLPVDLEERTMLGDAGANVLGACLAYAGLRVMDDPGHLFLLVGLLALNAASEFVSFSKVIRSVPVLERLDAMGRRSS